MSKRLMLKLVLSILLACIILYLTIKIDLYKGKIILKLLTESIVAG